MISLDLQVITTDAFIVKLDRVTLFAADGNGRFNFAKDLTSICTIEDSEGNGTHEGGLRRVNEKEDIFMRSKPVWKGTPKA